MIFFLRCDILEGVREINEIKANKIIGQIEVFIKRCRRTTGQYIHVNLQEKYYKAENVVII